MPGDVYQAWEAVATRLRELLNPDTYDRWIAGIVPLSLDNSVFRLGVSNDMFCEWLSNHYQDVIGNALQKVTGQTMKVSFVGGHEPRKHPARGTTAAATATAAAGADTPANAKLEHHTDKDDTAEIGRFNHRFSFDSFVVGEHNKFTHAACSAAAKMPGTAYNPLFVYGGTGLGKTHLLHAIGQDVLGRRRRAKVEYLTSEEFANRFIDALSTHSLPKFRQYFRTVDLLLIDDVQFFKGKVQLQEEFFHTFNALYNAHKQIVLVSDRPPHELDGVEKRLVSRFEWGLATEIQIPDYETRLAILRRKQEDQTVKVNPEVLSLIAARVKSNIRSLEGALVRVVAHASVSGVAVTPELAEKILAPCFAEDMASSSISIERIQKFVAEYYDVRLADMTSNRRPANIALPRQIAMVLCRRLTDLSTPVIGGAFNRNHATILPAVATVQAKLEKNGDFRNAVTSIERKLKA